MLLNGKELYADVIWPLREEERDIAELACRASHLAMDFNQVSTM